MFGKRADGSEPPEPVKKQAKALKKGTAKKSAVKAAAARAGEKPKPGAKPKAKDAAKPKIATKAKVVTKPKTATKARPASEPSKAKPASNSSKAKPASKPKPRRGTVGKRAAKVRRAASLLRSLAEPSRAIAAGTKARAAVQLHWSSRGGRAALAMLRALALLLLCLSVLELLRITLVPTPGSVGFVRPNMHPFATIRLYLRSGTVEEQVFQIGGNIALGFILGFLLPQITPYLRGLIRVEIVAVLFISVIEAVQHFFIPGTTLTVDDAILTAGGAALGYVPLGRMFGMRLHPYHLHWWQRILSRRVERRAGRRVPSVSEYQV